MISGGQTGADRAGLDAAMNRRIAYGGWCPKGRRAEDGRIPDRYPLQETESNEYITRTEKNIVDSDGTIVFTFGKPTGGSALTVKFVKKHKKPYLHIDLNKEKGEQTVEKICKWIKDENIHALNIAGSRESKSPGIHDKVYEIINNILEMLRLIRRAISDESIRVYDESGKKILDIQEGKILYSDAAAFKEEK